MNMMCSGCKKTIREMDFHVHNTVTGRFYCETCLREEREQVEGSMIDNPKHYTDGGIETIDFIRAKKLGFELGNVVKYVSRAGKKCSEIEDLKKAQWYLTSYIKQMESVHE